MDIIRWVCECSPLLRGSPIPTAPGKREGRPGSSESPSPLAQTSGTSRQGFDVASALANREAFGLSCAVTC